MRFPSIDMLIIFLIERDGISCNSPPSPVKCNLNDFIDCTVINPYEIFPNQETCRALVVIFLSSKEEVVEEVEEGSKKK
jgi:hypothetical protein